MLKSIARNTLFAVALGYGVVTTSPAAEATLHQVFEAVQAGKLAEADAMMNEVLKTHPDSAKAHFVHAEVLAREGRREDARQALATAEKLSPGLTFVKPSAVEHLRAMIDGRASALPAAEGAAPARHFSLLPIVVAIGGLLLVMFVVRAMSARRTVAQGQGYYPTGYAGGQGAYGGAPMAPGPMGGSGSGLGSSIATGLAMGAGLAAGEALVHRVLEGNRDSFGNPLGGVESGGLAETSRDAPVDRDFGVNDGSSWDDGSGYVDGSDLGAGDIGGDDWS